MAEENQKVRAYIKSSNGNSSVTEELPVSDGLYSLKIEDAFMAEGELLVGFEIYDDFGYIERLDPVTIHIDSFVSLSEENQPNIYVVTASVGEVKTLEASKKATVTNSGTNKDLILNFGIPKGEKGDSGERGPKGDKGDTPVKGIDYYTEDEKQKFIGEFENSIIQIADGRKNTKADIILKSCETTKRVKLTDSGEYPFYNLSIYGESTQNGTPTVDTSIDVTSVENPVLRVKGKNLLNLPYREDMSGESSITKNGITFTINPDGTITANGTATKDAYFRIISGTSPFSSYGEKIYFSGCPKGGSKSTYFIRQTNFGYYDIGGGKYTETKGANTFEIGICSGVTADNLVFKPQVEISGITPYEPSVEATEVTVPYKLRGIKDSAGNYISRDEISLSNDSVTLIRRIDEALDNCTTSPITGNIDFILSEPIITDITDTDFGKALVSLYTKHPSTTIVCNAEFSLTYKANTTNAYKSLESELDTLKQAIINLGGNI